MNIININVYILFWWVLLIVSFIFFLIFLIDIENITLRQFKLKFEFYNNKRISKILIYINFIKIFLFL